jgi:hypothetical protein
VLLLARILPLLLPEASASGLDDGKRTEEVIDDVIESYPSIRTVIQLIKPKQGRNTMKTTRLIAVGLVLVIYGSLGCESGMSPVEGVDSPESEMANLQAGPVEPVSSGAPSPMVTVNAGPNGLTFWPYTGTNFYGIPQDPINLIFFGEADPRDLRAALMALDGNRNIPGLPPVPPFNSTWTDAIGDIQTSYGSPDGWSGSVIQLECGDYQPLRFHMRMFQIGEWTVANAHFEVMVPGTSDHQVLSWELAEQFIVADFMRTGLLDPVTPVIPTAQINEDPYGSIPAILYNELPVELRMLVQGPLGDVTDDVPIQNDGHAVILNLADREERVSGTTHQDFTLDYGIMIPKPFCSSGPGDYVWVAGPVHLKQTVNQTPNGTITMGFQAKGELSVTPVNPITGDPIGETMTAFIRQTHASMMNDSYFRGSGVIYQRLGRPTDEAGGLLFTQLRVSSDGQCGYTATIRCGADPEGPVTGRDVTPAGLLTAASATRDGF